MDVERDAFATFLVLRTKDLLGAVTALLLSSVVRVFDILTRRKCSFLLSSKFTIKKVCVKTKSIELI